MKSVRWILWIILCLQATNLYADLFDYDSPYCDDYCDETLSLTSKCDLPYTFGVNFKQYWIKSRGDWQNFFVKEQPGFDVYFGWRVFPYFGIDLGYEWTANKPLSFVIPRGGSMLGLVNNTPRPITVTSKVRYKTGHADINAFIPISLNYFNCEFVPEGIISLGVGAMKPHMRIAMSPNNNSTYQYILHYIPMEGRSRAIFRGGLGIQTMLIEDFGFRFMWRYETTGLLRARNSVITVTPATREIFFNTHSLAAGLFVRF